MGEVGKDNQLIMSYTEYGGHDGPPPAQGCWVEAEMKLRTELEAGNETKHHLHKVIVESAGFV